MNEVIVRVVKMPYIMRGFVREDPEGDYNVYINQRLPSDTQNRVLSHELKHVNNNEIDNDASIWDIEK